jgi:hypothetical protein
MRDPRGAEVEHARVRAGGDALAVELGELVEEPVVHVGHDAREGVEGAVLLWCDGVEERVRERSCGREVG